MQKWWSPAGPFTPPLEQPVCFFRMLVSYMMRDWNFLDLWSLVLSKRCLKTMKTKWGHPTFCYVRTIFRKRRVESLLWTGWNEINRMIRLLEEFVLALCEHTCCSSQLISVFSVCISLNMHLRLDYLLQTHDVVFILLDSVSVVWVCFIFPSVSPLCLTVWVAVLLLG